MERSFRHKSLDNDADSGFSQSDEQAPLGYLLDPHFRAIRSAKHQCDVLLMEFERLNLLASQYSVQLQDVIAELANILEDENFEYDEDTIRAYRARSLPLDE